MSNEELITIIRDYFKSKPVLRAYLFGSRARNEATNQSDVDILVELDYSGDFDLLDFIRMNRQLSGLLRQKVDLVSARGLSNHIKPFIDQEKELIYEK